MKAGRADAYWMIAVAVPLLVVGAIWGGVVHTALLLACAGGGVVVAALVLPRFGAPDGERQAKRPPRMALEYGALLVFAVGCGYVTGGAFGIAAAGAVVLALGPIALARLNDRASATA